MPTIDPVILKLEADLRDYKRDLSQATRITDQKLGAIEKRGFAMGQSIKSGFNLAKGAAIGFAATVGVSAITNAIKTGLEYASSLGEVAQQIGVTTDALQEYRFAATQVGLSSEEMDQALSQLTRRIGEAASGTKAQAEAFQKLGISVKDAKGNIVATGDAIPKIADALAKIESPAARAAILMDLFGRAGQKLEPLLAGGSAAVNNLRNAAHSLGVVLSEDQIQRADETADKLEEVKTVLQANIASAVSNNTTAILALANAMVYLVVSAGKAAQAYTRFKLAQGEIEAGINADLYGLSPLPGDQRRAEQFAAQRDRFHAARAQIDGTQDKTGGFRDYRAAPIFGAKPSGATAAAAGAGAGAASTPKPSGGGGASGTSAAELAERAARAMAQFEDELGRLHIDLLRAQAEYTGNIKQRRDVANAAVDEELASFRRDLALDTEITGERRSQLDAAKVATTEQEKLNIEQAYGRALAMEQSDLTRTGLEIERDSAETRSELATTRRDQLAAELDLFDLSERLQDAEYDRILATEATASAVWQNAKREQEAARASRETRRDVVKQRNEGPGARYLRELSDEAKNLGDAYEEIAVRGLGQIEGGLTDTITEALGLHGVLGDIVGDFIQLAIRMAIIKPLAEALFGGMGGGSSGGGGILGSIIGAISGVLGAHGGAGTVGNGSNMTGGLFNPFGRASGGNVNPGQFYRVNEGASPGRVEGFMSRDGGQIIPLGQMNALRAPSDGGGLATVRIELSGDIDARIQRVSGPVAIEVVRAAAPTLIDASARETMARAGRPRL